MRNQTGFVEHHFDDFAQGHARRLFAHHIDHGHKAGQLCARFASGGTDSIVQRTTQTFGRILQLLHTACPNATRRKIHNAQETGVVVGVFQNSQVGQGVFNLSAFEEAQPSINLIRHTRIEQRRLHHATLRIAAIQDRDFFARQAIAFDQLTNFVDQPLRLGKVAGGFVHTHWLTRALIGPQILAQTIFVVANERIGRIQNVAVASVVLL